MGLLLLGTSCTALAVGTAPPSREWRFAVFLDGQRIGSHRFTMTDTPGAVAARTLGSEARFDVKLLGVTVYRYRHEVRERWRGNCIEELAARTDDDGKVVDVRARASEAGLKIESSDAAAAAAAPTSPPPVSDVAAACVMTFAYWNPALRTQRQLLDPATGKLQPVEILPRTDPPTDLRDASGSVRGWRIRGTAYPIDIWYSGDDWIGLDTTVARGRRLTYRLE